MTSRPAASRGQPSTRSPYGMLRPVALAACGYAVAAMAWLALGDTLPGGRWFAVHLFTLGILTNLVVALTEHFARTLLRAGPPGQRLGRFALLNVGALLLLGFPPALRYPLIAGAALLATAVVWLAVDLHRMRRRAADARFAFVVRSYEHACAAFIAGAVLGGLLGTQVLTGAWYGAGRLAHLHVNILGWGGLTLLATLVFLGPAMLRTQMVPGADARARVALPGAAGGLAVAVVGLLAGGSSPTATWPDLVAGAGLAAYALAAGVICWTVLRAGRAARPSAHAWMIQAASVWFLVVVWADAGVVAAGRWRLLDPLGAVIVVAVLGQAIMAALNHLTPMISAAGAAGRAGVRGRLETLARVRVVTLNLGAAVVLAAGFAGPAAGVAGAAAARTGWALVAAAVLAQVVLVVREARPGARRAGAR